MPAKSRCLGYWLPPPPVAWIHPLPPLSRAAIVGTVQAEQLRHELADTRAEVREELAPHELLEPCALRRVHAVADERRRCRERRRDRNCIAERSECDVEARIEAHAVLLTHSSGARREPTVCLQV